MLIQKCLHNVNSYFIYIHMPILVPLNGEFAARGCGLKGYLLPRTTGVEQTFMSAVRLNKTTGL
jgi:hypothetical protein